MGQFSHAVLYEHAKHIYVAYGRTTNVTSVSYNMYEYVVRELYERTYLNV